ncbi:MAG: sigma-54-dependent Fis family transcriptional regulator [Saprospiraceae bacterium]|jgi:DNA-binding NtrC family response regulator|nr:sigma-54-dependent Fis family transcriptional regulator [Saprospiraceae bacterium]MBP9210070.1 sigma-54-dependent Fis family transcriptional regulator [Saprospiraceae bacterium]MBV6472917.1 Anaerobic nitric oxide reductase transcription regulator NorR [Saprospiraceae bacterium]
MESVQSIKQRFGIYGRSEKLHQALDTAIRVAATDLTVLISGESGVGKEIFSKILHNLSPRKHNPFIAVNCGAIPAGTINSELFGHEKGSFTGATSDRKGYFETADGGTIFLDEIAEMPKDTQAFLLRVLESGEFIRVGSSKVLKTNVRVVAASNVDLLDQVRKIKFREDLYYRLNTVPIYVPPLKERREDILVLFRKFASDFAEKYRTSPIELDAQAGSLIENYNWPGNIRELRNAVEQLSVLSDQRTITEADILKIIPGIRTRNLPVASPDHAEQAPFHEREILYKLLFDMKQDLSQLKNMFYQLVHANDLEMPEAMEASFPGSSATGFAQVSPPGWTAEPIPIAGSREEPSPVILRQDKGKYDAVEVMEETLSLDEMEKELIAKVLKKFNGKRKDAAEELGISERTLYRKIKQYSLES